MQNQFTKTGHDDVMFVTHLSLAVSRLYTEVILGQANVRINSDKTNFLGL